MPDRKRRWLPRALAMGALVFSMSSCGEAEPAPIVVPTEIPEFNEAQPAEGLRLEIYHCPTDGYIDFKFTLNTGQRLPIYDPGQVGPVNIKPKR